MLTALTHLTILVNDLAEALEFYKNILGFRVHTDAIMQDGSRWLTLCLPGNKDFEFVLMSAKTEQDKSLVGKQAGTHSLGVLTTNNCVETYTLLKSQGVVFVDEPRTESWGTGATFKDLYGNMFYLVQVPETV